MRHKIMEGASKRLQGKSNDRGGTTGMRGGGWEEEGMKEEVRSTEKTASGNRPMEKKYFGCRKPDGNAEMSPYRSGGDERMKERVGEGKREMDGWTDNNHK